MMWLYGLKNSCCKRSLIFVVWVFIIFQPGQNYFIHSTRNAYLVYEYDIIYKELFDLARLSFGTL